MASDFPDIWPAGVTTGDNGSGTASDSLMTLTGEASNLTLLSDVIGVTGAATEGLSGAMADERIGVLLRDAQSSSMRVPQ